MSLDTAHEKMGPTRDERKFAFRIGYYFRSPRVAVFFWRRIEGRLLNSRAKPRAATRSGTANIHQPTGAEGSGWIAQLLSMRVGAVGERVLVSVGDDVAVG